MAALTSTVVTVCGWCSLLLMQDEVVHYEGVAPPSSSILGGTKAASGVSGRRNRGTVIDRLRQRYDFTDQDLTRIPDMAPYVDVRREPVGPHPEQATERGSRAL